MFSHMLSLTPLPCCPTIFSISCTAMHCIQGRYDNILAVSKHVVIIHAIKTHAIHSITEDKIKLYMFASGQNHIGRPHLKSIIDSENMNCDCSNVIFHTCKFISLDI